MYLIVYYATFSQSHHHRQVRAGKQHVLQQHGLVPAYSQRQVPTSKVYHHHHHTRLDVTKNWFFSGSTLLLRSIQGGCGCMVGFKEWICTSPTIWASWMRVSIMHVMKELMIYDCIRGDDGDVVVLTTSSLLSLLSTSPSPINTTISIHCLHHHIRFITSISSPQYWCIHDWVVWCSVCITNTCLETNKWFNLTGHNLDPRGSHSVVCSGIQLIYFGGVTAFGLANDLCVLDTRMHLHCKKLVYESCWWGDQSWCLSAVVPHKALHHHLAQTTRPVSLIIRCIYLVCVFISIVMYGMLTWVQVVAVVNRQTMSFTYWISVCDTCDFVVSILMVSGTMTWQQPATQGKTPAPRTYHSSAVVGKKMLIHGGAPDSKTTTAADPLFNDLFILDTGKCHHSFFLSITDAQAETMTWAEAKCNGTIPPAIGSHTITQVGRLVFLFGGFNGNVCFNHLFSLDLGKCGISIIRWVLTVKQIPWHGPSALQLARLLMRGQGIWLVPWEISCIFLVVSVWRILILGIYTF